MRFFGILALTLAVSPLPASAARRHPEGAPRGLLSEWPRDEGHHAVHSNTPRHGTLSPDLGATAALSTPASLGAPEDMHDPGDLAALASVPLLGGYTHIDGDGTGALDAGRYAMLKLNCARLLADPPCAPLDRAHILDAVSHITSVDYWFLNISTGAVPPRTLHFTIAVDDLSESHARDFDCPSLDRGEMAMYNLVRATENGTDVTNPCSFEPHPDASASLGASMPRVTGEKKKARVAWRPWDAPTAPLRADVLKNVTNQGTGSDLGVDSMCDGLKTDGSSSKADGSSSKADGSSSKADGSSAEGDDCVCADGRGGVFKSGGFGMGSELGASALTDSLKADALTATLKVDFTVEKADGSSFEGDGSSAIECVCHPHPEDVFNPHSYPPVPHYECQDVTIAPDGWNPPLSYDLRDEWGDVCEADVPADQGRCGSCWAHAFASMFSYRMCIQSGGKLREMISAQQLISCDWGGTCAGGYDGFTARHFDNHDGGLMAMPAASDFPYTDGIGVRTEGSGEKCLVRGMVPELGATENVAKQTKFRSYAVDFSTYETANYWYEQPVDERSARSIKSIWLENCNLDRTVVQSEVTLDDFDPAARRESRGGVLKSGAGGPGAKGKLGAGDLNAWLKSGFIAKKADGSSFEGDGSSSKGDECVCADGRGGVLKSGAGGSGAKGKLGADALNAWLKSGFIAKKADGSSFEGDGSSAMECVCDTQPVSNRIEQQRWLMYQIETFGPVTAVMSAASFPHGGDPTRVHSCEGPCDTVDHAVVIVGWGVSSVKDGEEPYWIVQNSWTDKWKDKGRVKIKRGSNTCCIEDRWMKIDPDFSETYDPEDFSDQPACANGGTIDRATNKCECPFPWSNGPDIEVAREGCEVCGILECANGGALDAHSCACACPAGYGGLMCDSAFLARTEMTKAGCTIHATLESDDAQLEEDIVIAVKIGENKNWIPFTHLGELCGVGEAGSKLGKSRMSDLLKASVWGTDLKANESSAKDEGTYAKGSCTKGSINATLDLAARDIHPHPNEEICVRFVRDLGVNEFGVARGYDFAFFGDAAEAAAGTCSPPPRSFTRSSSQRVASALGFTRESARGEVASKKNGLVIAAASFAVLTGAFVAAKAVSKLKSAAKKGSNSDRNSFVSEEAQPLLRRAM